MDGGAPAPWPEITPQEMVREAVVLVYWGTGPSGLYWGVGALACQVLSQPLCWISDGQVQALRSQARFIPSHSPEASLHSAAVKVSLHLWVTVGLC